MRRSCFGGRSCIRKGRTAVRRSLTQKKTSLPGRAASAGTLRCLSPPHRAGTQRTRCLLMKQLRPKIRVENCDQLLAVNPV